MKELMIMVATMMPEEQILNEMKDAIEDFLILPSNEKRDQIGMLSTLFTIRHTTKGETKNAMDMIENMDKLEQQSKIFTVNKN